MVRFLSSTSYAQSDVRHPNDAYQARSRALDVEDAWDSDQSRFGDPET